MTQVSEDFFTKMPSHVLTNINFVVIYISLGVEVSKARSKSREGVVVANSAGKLGSHDPSIVRRGSVLAVIQGTANDIEECMKGLVAATDTQATCLGTTDRAAIYYTGGREMYKLLMESLETVLCTHNGVLVLEYGPMPQA